GRAIEADLAERPLLHPVANQEVAAGVGGQAGELAGTVRRAVAGLDLVGLHLVGGDGGGGGHEGLLRGHGGEGREPGVATICGTGTSHDSPPPKPLLPPRSRILQYPRIRLHPRSSASRTSWSAST